MSEVKSGGAFHNLVAHHSKAIVLNYIHIFFIYRMHKTRPTCSRIKFFIRTKQWFTGGGTYINPFFMIVVIGIFEWRFSALFYHNVILLLGQYSLPFTVRFSFGKKYSFL